MIDKDAKELLEIAAELATVGALILDAAVHIKNELEKRQRKRPRNRIRRKHKR